MAINVYIGGTTGMTDGTLDIEGDGIGLSLTAVNSAAVAHLRAPSGYRNSGVIQIAAPTDYAVSADGTTFVSSLSLGAGDVTDTNVPVYVKRTSGTDTELVAVAIVGLDGVELIPDTEAPVIAGTLTATPTATQGQVTLAGPTATDNVGIAKWQYQVDGGAWVDVASTSGTFPSTVVSGLLVGSHDFAVRAVDAASNTSAALTDSVAVVLGVIYEQDFSGVTLGASVLGYDGWERRPTVANNTYSTFNAATYSGERMVELQPNVSDPAPPRAYMSRAFSVDTTAPVKVTAKFATPLANLDFTVAGVGSFQLTTTAFKVFRAGAYADIAVGLTAGAIHTISVTATAGSSTADIVVDGVAYDDVTLNAAATTITQIAAGCVGATAYDTHFGDLTVEAV